MTPHYVGRLVSQSEGGWGTRTWYKQHFAHVNARWLCGANNRLPVEGRILSINVYFCVGG